MTFCSTVNAIIHSGAKPILVDIDEGTFNIDYKNIQKITKKLKQLLLFILLAYLVIWIKF